MLPYNGNASVMLGRQEIFRLDIDDIATWIRYRGVTQMRRKTRVLHSLFRVGSGGVEQTRLVLARQLDPSRYEQRIVCLDAFGTLPRALNDASCAVDVIGNGTSIFRGQCYRDALGVIATWQPDIIHGAVYEGVAVAAIAGQLGRVPVIIGEETSDPAGRSWRGHALYRMLSGLTNHMVGVSPAVSEYLTGTLGLPRHKTSTIMNGVSMPDAVDPAKARAIRNQFDIREDSFVVGTVGRLEDGHKRVSDLIRALRLLDDSIPDARLLVVGDGEDRRMLADLSVALGVAERVHFAGYQGSPADYYPVMDVFALASAHEAFGLVLVEAMFAKLPVVATRVGGIPWVVDDGQSGMLVPPLDPPALASSIRALHDAPSLRASMSQKGYAKAHAEFGAERYVREVDALYTDLLAKKMLH